MNEKDPFIIEDLDEYHLIIKADEEYKVRKELEAEESRRTHLPEKPTEINCPARSSQAVQFAEDSTDLHRATTWVMPPMLLLSLRINVWEFFADTLERSKLCTLLMPEVRNNEKMQEF
ncbi:hypothetical protein J3R82DRAFT_1757 [Butyriboletus roseoflavus]|nr:hypothetical protein J3R82DRAFT_1757 [Butyriboletus roseoflavus]